MSISTSARSLRRVTLPFALFCIFLIVLWIAGGAARADVLGQVVVRLAAVALLVVLVLFGERPTVVGACPVWWLLLGAIAIAAMQLVPLPPAVWQALPGRAMFAEATLGQPQPWRPLALVPGAATNALISLIVPLVMLLIISGVGKEERSLIPNAILAMIVAADLLGLLQLSGVSFNNPFINDTPGGISSAFANRNHFALLLALGCLLVPVWVFAKGQRARGRAVIGLGLILLFLLTVLATGSRAGMVLAAIAVCGGLLAARHPIRRELDRAPRWAFPVLIALIGGLVGATVLLSIAADRAASIQRVFEVDTGQDMRSRALPTILAMTRDYFPAGAGLGGFDPVFRVHEPLALLKPTYFNHAHNDLLEIVLDAGLPGLALLVGAAAWWVRASIRVWQRSEGGGAMLPQIGSAMLFVIVLASLFDYPARTPTMAALIVVAAWWLHAAEPAGRHTADLGGSR